MKQKKQERDENKRRRDKKTKTNRHTMMKKTKINRQITQEVKSLFCFAPQTNNSFFGIQEQMHPPPPSLSSQLSSSKSNFVYCCAFGNRRSRYCGGGGFGRRRRSVLSSSSLTSSLSLSSRSLSNIMRNAKSSSSSRTSLIATAAAGTSFSSIFSSGAAASEPARAALFVTSGYVLVQVMRTVFNHKTLSDVSVSCQNTEKNASVLKMLHTLRVGYDAITVLRNPHMSTILATFFRKDVDVEYQRELLPMACGGVVALDWPLSVDDETHKYRERTPEMLEKTRNLDTDFEPHRKSIPSQTPKIDGVLEEHYKTLPEDAPTLVLMSGIAGGSHDKYLKHMLRRAVMKGYRVVAFNARGTSESPLMTPQFYSASFTGDTRAVMGEMKRRFPNAPLFAVGWSLGANILTNTLGEDGEDALVDAACSMCNPFDLNRCDENLQKGFWGKLYSKSMANNMRKLFEPHKHLFQGLREYEPALVRKARTVRDFDEAITRVTFGFSSVDAYYEASGSKRKIADVRVPLLCVQAKDDPIASIEAIPREAIASNEHVILLETESGGHLGWTAGAEAPWGAPWPDQVAMEFFEVHALEWKTKRGANTARAKAPAEVTA